MSTIPKPPKLADRLLKWRAGAAQLEDIQGDLEELYELHYLKKGKRKADLKYWQQVLSLLFSYAINTRKNHSAYSYYYPTHSAAMISNYFKIAFRNFSKHKLFTSLNVVGLSLGMCICLLALSMAVAIYRADEFHVKKDRIYQINTAISDSKNSKTFGSTFNALGNHLEDNYPFIEEVVKIKAGFSPEIIHHGNTLSFRGYFADATFFTTFSFPMISGNPTTALSKPYSIVITEKVAETLYRGEDPMGKILETDFGPLTITGVMKNLKQTHLFFEILTSHQTYEQLQTNDSNTDWTNYRNNYLYTLIKPSASKTDLTEALAQSSLVAAEFFSIDHKIQLESIELTNAVPRWNISNAIGIGWDQPSLIFFFTIGLLVLLPAIFNYTNLSIARALKRGKEIGLRKVMGAEKHQIKAQFLVETIILALIALLGSVIIFIPLKKEFLGMIIAASVLDTSMGFIQITVFILFAVMIGVLAGIFPAQYFSKLNPIRTMKGSTESGGSNVSGFRKGLFVFQFFLSLVFIIGVATIARQYSYALNTNHGFQSNNVLTVPFKTLNKKVVLTELSNHPDVKAITTASHLPGLVVESNMQVTSNELDTIDAQAVFVGNQFIEQMEMALSWGSTEDFYQSNKTEEKVLVNRSFMKSIAVFNTQKDTLRFTLADGTRCRIVGIAEDMNYEPLSKIIKPLVFRHSVENSNFALLTISTTNIKKTINDLDAIWLNIDENTIFEATFLDDEIEKAYYFLTVQIKFFSFLGALAITISCLGLLGMVSYTTENRTKEIAVRKIMGASNQSLYFLLTKNFIKLIAISAAIAIPFSYFFFEKLFLYSLIRYGRGLGIIEVLGSVLFLFMVGFASIYWQTSKVANANPSDNLRYE